MLLLQYLQQLWVAVFMLHRSLILCLILCWLMWKHWLITERVVAPIYTAVVMQGYVWLL